MTGWTAQARVLMTHEIGLHARPSVSLTKMAKGFDAVIELGLNEGGPWIDAKSIVKVMAAKAPKGTVLHFRAKGGDADEAVAALTDLVTRDFGEGPADGGG